MFDGLFNRKAKIGEAARGDAKWIDVGDNVRAALDCVPANVFIVDLDFRLIYANRAATKALRDLSDVLRKEFNVDANDVIGGSIHRFHRDTTQFERLLRDPGNLPREGEFKFGGVTLKGMVEAVTGDDGRPRAYIASWSNVTETARHEHRFNESVESMMKDVIAMAGGDLKRKITVSGSDSVGLMGNALTRLVDDLNETMTRVSGDAQTLASASEQMRASVQEISRNTSEAATVTSEAVQAAESTGVVIERLDKMSSEIGEVTRLISRIAEQTNLLALNATIEAARAGEAGKGFAVVANEVKELAKETSQATSSIGSRVEQIQAETANAVKAVSSIVTIARSINDRQSAIAGAVEEQTATTTEFARIATALKGVTGKFNV